MKKFFFSLAWVSVSTLSAQVIVFTQATVPAELAEAYEKTHVENVQKVAAKAIEKGELIGWRMLRKTNTGAKTDGSQEVVYLFIDGHKDFESYTQTQWWSNTQSIGKEFNEVYDVYNKGVIEYSPNYIYKLNNRIPQNGELQVMIINLFPQMDVEAMTDFENQYVKKGFTDLSQKNSMSGWASFIKVFPQGDDHSAYLTIDAFKTYTDALEFLSVPVFEFMPEGAAKAAAEAGLLKQDYRISNRPIYYTITHASQN